MYLCFLVVSIVGLNHVAEKCAIVAQYLLDWGRVELPGISRSKEWELFQTKLKELPRTIDNLLAPCIWKDKVENANSKTWVTKISSEGFHKDILLPYLKLHFGNIMRKLRSSFRILNFRERMPSPTEEEIFPPIWKMMRVWNKAPEFVEFISDTGSEFEKYGFRENKGAELIRRISLTMLEVEGYNAKEKDQKNVVEHELNNSFQQVVVENSMNEYQNQFEYILRSNSKLDEPLLGFYQPASDYVIKFKASEILSTSKGENHDFPSNVGENDIKAI